MNLKLTSPFLDEVPITGENGRIQKHLVIRGVIDPASIESIQTAPYQREVISGSKIRSLVHAIRTSILPDVELGMRGERFREHDGGSAFTLLDEIFVIDGLQRINASRQLLTEDPTASFKIGALVHLDTTFDWERERFRILNQERTKLSPNVLLRNACPDHHGIRLVHALTTNGTGFILSGKICWEQRQGRGHLLTASRICNAINTLHGRFGNGTGDDGVVNLSIKLDEKHDAVGSVIMKDNIRTFFDTIDECWNIRDVKYSEKQPQLKGTFLEVFADFLSDHDQFWQDKRLILNKRQKEKLAKFQISDPEISRLCGSGGAAKSVLKATIIDHFNKGRRNGRLNPEGSDSGQE